jgi:hypothetical protein
MPEERFSRESIALLSRLLGRLDEIYNGTVTFNGQKVIMMTQEGIEYFRKGLHEILNKEI